MLFLSNAAVATSTTSASIENQKPASPADREEKATEPNQTVSVETQKTHDGQRIFASPLARKIAKEKGVSLSDIKGSGDQGRIVKKDIENYQPSQKTAESNEVASKEAVSVSNAIAPINLPVGEGRQ